jgi:hypothetical protein
MDPCQPSRRAKAAICALLAVAIGLPLPARGGDLLVRAKAHWDNHVGAPTAEALAVQIEHLEKHINCYGTIVAKQPDVWGQARMMKHRQDFERTIAQQLTKFEPSLQGSLSRTDQAYLASALSLSAAISGAPAVQLPQSAATSQEIVARQRALLNAQGVANPTTEQLQALPAPTVINIPTENPASGLVQDFSTTIQRSTFNNLSTGLKYAESTISIAPTEFLDQMANYIHHLNELRRINEGDDTADSPGYGLHLIRIPISILPGTLTRKGYGAQITITATPYLGRDLLPTTFRNLVVNDLVSQTSAALTEYFNSRKSREIFERIRDQYLAAARQAEEEFRQFGLGGASLLSPPSAYPGRQPGARSIAARSPSSPARRDAAVRRTAQEGDITATPLPVPATPDEPRRAAYRGVFQRALERQFSGRAEAARKEVEASISRVSLAGVPTTRSRNARYAFPGTQIGEVYGAELILPVAFGTYDAVLSRRLQDDPTQPNVVQYQRVAGFVQDQVVAAYDFLARPELASVWASFATPEVAVAVRTRDEATLRSIRTAFLASLPGGGIDPSRTYGTQYSTTAAFAWAILVESVLLSERLIQDIHETAAAKGMPVPAADDLPFFLPCPPEEARTAFNEYVRLRFPIHVFALHPTVSEQNIADQLTRTRELQLALSLAFVTGNISASSMTRFARRLELQAETIALNRTQVAFSHGEDVFGWRFQPRFQTPPTPGNLTAFAQTLVGGPSREADLRQRELESGMRECVAIVIMPSFVPYVTFEARSNWYRLGSPKHTEIDTLKFLELSRSVQRARAMAQAVCDSGLYRSGDVAGLLTRVNQLSAGLPFQAMIAQVPYENTRGGFELFNVGVTDLDPELRSWYGVPGVSVKNGTSLFLVGDGFSVHETSVIVGNKLISGDALSLLSRQVMRVNVPPGVQTVIRSGQPFVEATVATPYGVSQALYIPAVDAAQVLETKPAPPSAFSIDPSTQALKISYTLKDAAGNRRAGEGFVNPPGQTIRIVSTSPTGVAPKRIQVDFTFTYKKVPFSIPSLATATTMPIQATGDKGTYTIDGASLAQIAREYVDQLNRLDNFTIDSPLPTLETTGIMVRSLSGDGVLDEQAVPMSNSLTVVPTPVPVAPPAATGARQLGGAAPQAPGEAAPPPPEASPERRTPPLPPANPGARIAPRRPQGTVAPTTPSEAVGQTIPKPRTLFRTR